MCGLVCVRMRLCVRVLVDVGWNGDLQVYIVCEVFNWKDLVFFTSSNFTKLRGDIILVMCVVNLSTT